MKKFLSAILVGAMSLTLLAGCGEKAEAPAENKTATESKAATENKAATTGDVSHVVILYPGEETDAMANFIDNQLNPRLREEEGIEVELIYKGWDQYWDQKKILLSANQTIDLYWDGLPDLAKMVNDGEAQPIGDLIKENCPDMLKVFPDSQLAGGVVNGEQYGIPSAYAPSSAMFQLVCVRQDIMDAVGMTDLKTADDLKQFATLAKQQFPEMNGPADVIFKPLTRYFADEQYSWCALNDTVVYGETTKKAYSYFETEAFQEVAKFNQSMYDEGLYKDELCTNYNERDSRMQQGTYLWVEGSLGKDREIISSVRGNAPDAQLKTYLLKPDSPKYSIACGGEVLCVPYSAANPAGAMKFLNWLYKNQENYLFAIYGPEGENYDIVDGRIALKDPAFEGYFYEWMFRNANYTMFTSEVSDAAIEEFNNWDDGALTSDVIAFHFNNTGFEEMETAITEVINQRFVPIECGYVDFDTAYPAAVEELKNAGIDEYIAEVNRQLEAFFAENGYNN